jgi:ATP-dependent DNA helicase RecG
MFSNPGITMAEIADTIGISIKAVEKQIASLKREGKIERLGSDKGGRWKINEVNP